ncbi:MAG: cell wall metabolism sensor histidine kinase WalK, partial [Marinosulfonomonas sp.]|nr:cell wall metabolism sensor histidine kinase WalK [Marinosulfonomonas sp.]
MNSLKLDELLEAFAIPVIAVAQDERVLAMNAGARALTGSGLVGRHYVAVIRHPVLISCIEDTLKSGKPGEADYVASHATGEGSYRVRANPVDLGGARGVIVSFEDNSQVRQIDEMRRDFVANVSHELRTPLTALLGFIETLRGAARDDPAAQERFLTTMLAEAERMNRLIGDLLSLSRVESNERIRPTGHIDIVEVIRAAWRNLEPLVGANEVTVKIIANDDPVF